jgi:hypothetical protein
VGGSFAFADPDARLGYAYVMNKLDFYLQNGPREKAYCATRCTARLGLRTEADGRLRRPLLIGEASSHAQRAQRAPNGAEPGAGAFPSDAKAPRRHSSGVGGLRNSPFLHLRAR